MPPLCSMWTWPEISLTLQVPHMPCVHEDASRTPDCLAASRTLCVDTQVISRRLFWNCTEYIWMSAMAEASSARSEEHTSELQSLMRISYAVFCLKKKNH